MKKKQIYSMIFLTILTIIMIILITPANSIFGSMTDYLNQHINIADYLRHTILQQKTLLPDFAFNLGAGQNMYNFSYYGLLRIDVLIACLLPAIAMKDIVVGYMIINLILSVNLVYLWLRQKQFDSLFCLIGAVLLLSSSVLFQSHRQIMFVAYMPFLIMALMAVDRYLQKGKSRLLIIAIVGIITTSYFFSVCAIVVIFSYYCYEMMRLENKITVKKLLIFIKPIIIAILICSVLLLPTAYVMLENHHSGLTTANLLSLLLPRFNFEALLYDGYGCGLTYLAWAGLVLGLKLKKTRGLSIGLLLVIFIPVFSFCLNGFLYARSKILIPCIPLIIYLVVLVLDSFKQIKINIKEIIFLSLPLLFVFKEPLIILDMFICLLGIMLYLKKDRTMLLIVIVTPLICSYTVNQKEEFVTLNTYQETMQLSKVKGLADSRLDIFKQPLNTANQGIDKARTSIYSSISNHLYNQFYYDIINNPIRIKNRVAQLSNSNIFFQELMGVKTLYSKAMIPVGYHQVGENLYQNNDVLPLVYASSNLYSETAFDKLPYYQKLDTLYNNTIIKTKNHDYQSKVKKVNLDLVKNYQDDFLTIDQLSHGYRINTPEDADVHLAINNLKNEILIIEFDLERVKLIDFEDTAITINNITNKLSSNNAAYPNNNHHFTYVLSQNEAIDKLKIKFSKGTYDLTNVNVYSLDYQVIKERCKKVDALEGVYNHKNMVVDGFISVSNDGYLVTSFPYQNGFTILIDDKKVENECVNKAFLGTKVSKGKHHIKIIFRAPMKRISYLFSGLGIILLISQGRKEQ